MDSALIECARKTVDIVFEVVKFCVKVAVTLFSLCFLVIGLLDFVQWCSLVDALRKVSELSEFWSIAFASALFALIDLATLFPAVITFLSWRSCKMCYDIKHELASSSSEEFCFKSRMACWYAFLLVIWDIPCGALLIVSSAFFWRIPSTIKVLFLKPCDWHPVNATWRSLGLLQLFFGLLDIFTLPFFLFALSSIRSCEMIRRIKDIYSGEKSTTNVYLKRFDFHEVVLVAAWNAFLDLLGFIGFILCAFCPWRWKAMADSCKTDATEARGAAGANMNEVPWRILGYLNSMIFLMDVLTVIPLVVTMISWRSCIMCNEVMKALKDFEKNIASENTLRCCFEARQEIWKNFLMVFFDIPFILMVAFATLTVVRVVPLWKRLRAHAEGSSYSWHFTDYRSVIFDEFVDTLLDILGYLGFIFCVCPWRWKAICDSCTVADSSAASSTLSMHKLSWRVVGYINSAVCILDIFTLIPLIPTLLTWRTAHMYIEVSDELAAYEKRGRSAYQCCLEARGVIWMNFLRFLTDIPFIVMSFVAFFSIVRSYPFSKQVFRKSTESSPQSCDDSGCNSAGAVAEAAESEPRRCSWYFADYREIVFAEFCLVFVDYVCFAGFLPCLLCPWRWKSMYETIRFDEQEEGDKNQHPEDELNKHQLTWRVVGFLNSVFCIVDIVTFAPFVITVLSWRCVHVFSDIKAASREFEEQGRHATQYCFVARVTVWINFMLAIVDLPFIVLALFVTLSVVRSYHFWVRVCAKAEERDHEHAKSSTETTTPPGCCAAWYSKDYRSLVFFEFLRTLALVFLLPLLLLLGATIYRIPCCRSDIKKAEEEERRSQEKEQPAQQRSKYELLAIEDTVFIQSLGIIAWHAISVPIDALFVPFGLLVVFSLFRAHKFIRLLTNVPAGQGPAAFRRLETIVQFFYLIRDIFFIALTVLLFLSPIRMYLAMREVWRRSRRSTDPAPLVQVTQVTSKFIHGVGWQLSISGLKNPDLRIEDAEIDFIGDRFWDSFAENIGYSVRAIARLMLPMQLCPKYLDKARINNGLPNFEIVIDLRANVKRRTIIKKLNLIIRSAPVEIVVYCDNRARTLFALVTTPGELLDAEEQERPMSLSGLRASATELVSTAAAFAAEDERIRREFEEEMREIPMVEPHSMQRRYSEPFGERVEEPAPEQKTAEEMYGPFVCDLYWSCVGSELLEVPIDLIAAICFVIVHIVPFRAYYMYKELAESISTGARRSISSLLESFATISKRNNADGSALLASVQLVLNTHFKDCAVRTGLTIPLANFVNETKNISDEIRARQTAAVATTAADLVNASARLVLLQCAAYTIRFWTYEGHTRYGEVAPNYKVSAEVFFGDDATDKDAEIYRRGAVQVLATMFQDSISKLTIDSGDLYRACSIVASMDDIMASHGEKWRTIRDDAAAAQRKLFVDIDNELARLQLLSSDDVSSSCYCCTCEKTANEVRATIFHHFVYFWVDLLYFVLIIVLFLTVYRAWSVIYILRNASRWKRELLYLLLEILLDIVFLLMFLLVLVTLIHAVSMIVDLVLCIYRERSFDACRVVILRHVQRLGETAVAAAHFFFSLKFVKYFVATALFLPLTPAELMSSLIGVKDVCAILLITAVFYACPFIAVYVLSPKGFDYFQWGLIAIAAIISLLTIVAMMIITRRTNIRELWETDMVNPVNAKYLRLSSRYVYHFVVLILEAYQLCSLPFHLNGDWGSASWPHTAAKWAFLSDADSTNYYPAGYYLSFTAVLLFALVFSLPIVYHSLLKHEGKIWHSPIWHLLVDFLGSTLVLTVTFNLMSFAICTSGDPAMMTVGSIAKPCWYSAKETRKYGLIALLGMIYYAPSVILKSTRWPEPCTQLSVRFHGYVVTIQSLLHLVLAGLAAFLYDKAAIYCVIQLIALIVYLALTLKNEEPFLPAPRLCTIWEFNCWQNAAHLCGIFSSIVTLIAIGSSAGSSARSVMTTVFIVLCILVIVGTLLRVYVAPRCTSTTTPREEDEGASIDLLRKGLIAFQEMLHIGGGLVAWNADVETKWKADAEKFQSCDDFVNVLMSLDGHIEMGCYTVLFREAHPSWAEQTSRLGRVQVLNEDSLNDLSEKFQALKNGTAMMMGPTSGGGADDNEPSGEAWRGDFSRRDDDPSLRVHEEFILPTVEDAPHYAPLQHDSSV